ncbi:unnamed protein product [Rhizoctonia solani]|uniref:Heterokaryon incompatibility domain-containing protein n=1 Tax=Rhizoctonia solani TaxID=456999 RepID=A0A8H2WMH7_9AGAM|nr:unnamed protein product [Rhizoctonia solani]
MADAVHNGQVDGKLVYTYRPITGASRFNVGSCSYKHYRFMKCSTFIKQGLIDLYEYRELPVAGYVIISYVWNGLAPLTGDNQITFEVLGDENRSKGAQPISVELLKSACQAAVQKQIDLLWLDQLCIKQSDNIDKAWQMENMHDIYKNSNFCIVFPGGLRRFSNLSEETQWIDRGWTLQEAIAPPNVQVMFQWTEGSCDAAPDQWLTRRTRINAIMDQQCAIAPLSLLLDGTLNKGIKYWPDREEIAEKECRQPVNIFGRAPDEIAPADYPRILPNVAALAIIAQKTVQPGTDSYYHTIWKSTLMRTTKYRCDVIFSVMGLFNVSLSPSHFTDENGRLDRNDCIRPAMELTKKIIEGGGRATWLGISPLCPPCPQLTSFPLFPRYSPAERALIVDFPKNRWVRASRLMINEYVNPSFKFPFPAGAITKQGDMLLYVKCLSVAKVVSCPQGEGACCVEDTNGAIWCQQDTGGSPVAYAAILCAFKTYSPFNFKAVGFEGLRGFILVKNRTYARSWYLESYFAFNDEFLDRWFKQARYMPLHVGAHDPDRELHNYVEDRITRLRL